MHCYDIFVDLIKEKKYILREWIKLQSKKLVLTKVSLQDAENSYLEEKSMFGRSFISSFNNNLCSHKCGKSL